MLFKVVVFRADYISGWCADPKTPDTPVTLKMVLNGDAEETFVCDRPRKDLKQTSFHNRDVGFIASVPLRYWTGEDVSVVIRTVDEENEELATRTVPTVDVRVPGVAGVYAEVADVTGGRLRGWADSEAGPVQVQLDIDGTPFARTRADGETEARKPAGRGFAFWLPSELYDGSSHRVALQALLPNGRTVRIFEKDLALSPDDAPFFRGEVTSFELGTMSGEVRIEGAPDLPVTLVAVMNGSEIGRALSNPEQSGAFVLALAPEAPLVVGRDLVEIFSEETGTTPAFLAGDPVAAALHFALDDATPGQLGLSLRGPLPLAGTEDAWLEIGDLDQGIPVSFAVGADAFTLAADIVLPGDLAAAPLGPVLLHVGPSLLLAPISAARGADAPTVETPEEEAPAEPAVAGQWRLEAGGVVHGWARNAAAPDTPVSVNVLINGLEVATLRADRYVHVGDAGGSLPAACGFVCALAELGRVGGIAEISVRIVGGEALPTHGPTRQRFPIARTASRPAPGEMFGLPGYAALDADDEAKFRAPVDAVLADAIARTFGVAAAEGRPLAAVLAEAAIALAGNGALLASLRTVGGQLDPAVWSPVKPLPTELADLLPLRPQTRKALAGEIDWRGFLRRLLADGILFPTVIARDDWSQTRALFALRDAAGVADLAAPVVLEIGADATPTGDAAIGADSAIVVVDPTGRPALVTDGRSDALAALTGLARTVSAGPKGAAQTGWYLLTRTKAGVAAVHPLTFVPSRRDSSIRVNENVTLTGMKLAPRHAEITLRGAVLHHRTVLRLGKAIVQLAPCPPIEEGAVSSGEEIERTYAASLPDWSSEQATFELAFRNADLATTYDLRLGDKAGPRPSNLPITAGPAVPATLVASPLAVEHGVLTGWVFHAGEEAGSITLSLIEAVPPPPEVLEQFPDALPTDKFLATGRASLASPETVARYAVRSGGYTLGLPAVLLDGAPHSVRLVASGGFGDEVIWQQDFAADTDFLMAQIAGCSTSADLQRWLTTLADARQFEVLRTYFRRPHALAGAVLNAEETFDVLCGTAVWGGTGADQADLGRLFGTLWDTAAQDEKRLLKFTQIATRAILRSLGDLPAARYPHGPSVEALMDLVLAAPLDKAPPEIFVDLAAACNQAHRFVLARRILDRGLAAHANNNGMLVLKANVALAMGDTGEAETALLQALTEKPGAGNALQMLARVYARQGRPLHAAAALTGGQGLSYWIAKPPNYDQSKFFAGMDWVGMLDVAAQQSRNPRLAASVAISRAVQGEPDRPEDDGLTVVLTSASPENACARFPALRPIGCLQVVGGLDGGISEVECVGRWALVLSDPELARADLIAAIFAQKRPSEPVVRLTRGVMAKTGAPEGFDTVGALIRADALRAFGPCSLEAYLDRADAVLRVKTVLV